jgi:hypothetical protein
MEQGNVFDLASIDQPISTNVTTAPFNHAGLRGTSIAGYFCPSRRTPPALTTNPANTCSVGDYAAVAYGIGQQTISGTTNRIAFMNGSTPNPTGGTTSATRANQPRTWDGAIVVCRAFNRTTVPNTIVINGFQAQTLGGREFRSMTSFASVLDGLSNTAFVGEKAVHKDNLGVAGNTTATITGVPNGDGPYYYHNGNTTNGTPSNHAEVAAFMRRLCLQGSSATAAPDNGRVIPLKPTGDANTSNAPHFRFGSWHPGVSLFLLGDGSVRQVNNATATVALERFGPRNDRLTFDLP